MTSISQKKYDNYGTDFNANPHTPQYPKIHPYLKWIHDFQGHPRDIRIIKSPEIIQEKLESEWDFAQEQMTQEPPKAYFQYIPYDHIWRGNICESLIAFFDGFTSTSERLFIGNREVGICHAQGLRKEMEDHHIATEFTIFLQGKLYTVQLFGIFDGHGGNQAALYVKMHLAKTLQKHLEGFNTLRLTDQGIWNALKLTLVSLNEGFKLEKSNLSGTTATISMILDDKLWTANVGDSRTILEDVKVGTMSLSEDSKPDNPRYLKSIHKRGGLIATVQNVARVSGVLSIGRAIGDVFIKKGLCPRPKITMIPFYKIAPGSHLILACDGLYDVVSSTEVGLAIATNCDEPADAQAKNLVYSAYKAGSSDNISALIVKL